MWRGGDTTTAASFPITALAGGNSSTSDYYGVDKTWYTGASWTQPVFDAAQTQIGNFFTLDNADYFIIDNIEMKNQNLTFAYGGSSAIQDAPGGVIAVVHTVVENVYIHDFMTSGTLSNANGSPWYSAGGIRGYVVLKNSTIDDSGGFGKNASGTTVTGGMIGGGCENCQEVSGSKFVDTVAACFQVHTVPRHGNHRAKSERHLWCTAQFL